MKLVIKQDKHNLSGRQDYTCFLHVIPAFELQKLRNMASNKFLSFSHSILPFIKLTLDKKNFCFLLMFQFSFVFFILYYCFCSCFLILFIRYSSSSFLFFLLLLYRSFTAAQAGNKQHAMAVIMAAS